MTYQEELHYTQQLLTHMALGNAFEVEGIVFIQYNDDYIAAFTTKEHLKIYNKLKQTQKEFSLN